MEHLGLIPYGRVEGEKTEMKDKTVTQHLGGSTSVPDKTSSPAPAWTPGPWLIRVEGTTTGRGPEVYSAEPHYDDGSNFVIADCGCSEATGGGKRWKRTSDADMIEANARLIAAAPELAQAVLLACLMFERKNHSNAEADWLGDDEHEAWTALRKALAKARGEA